MIYLCFCAYNESADLPELLSSLNAAIAMAGQPACVLAYNDGSKDATASLISEAATKMPLIFLDSKVNQGLGGGIETVMKYLIAHANDDDIAIFFDADNTHDLSVLPGFVAGVANGSDIVIASRFQPASVNEGFPLYRWMLSQLASRYFRIVLRVPGIKDYTSGFRAYRVGILKKLTWNTPVPRGFECQVELLHRLAPFSRVSEIPFRYQYDKKRGTSKMRLFRTIWNNIKVGLCIVMRRQRPAGDYVPDANT